MNRAQHVLVIGGGLVGLCCAYSLLREGHTVTIVERKTLGSGAALGNAGEVTPLQVTPLSSPRMMKDIVGGIFSSSSYLSIAKSKLPGLAGFGFGFMRSANSKTMTNLLSALEQLTDGIFPSFDEMARNGIDISGGGSGYLFTSSRVEEIEEMHGGFAKRSSAARQNGPGEVLRGDALLAFEPALTPEVKAGFMLPAERYLSPMRFVSSLVAMILGGGATVLENTRAIKLREVAGKPGVEVSGASGEQETLTADAIVVAAGVWSKSLLGSSRVHASLAAGKGYSFTVPIERMPSSLIHSVDQHFVATPMDGKLRIAGVMEFDGHPERLNDGRIEFLAKVASSVISHADWENRSDEWVGPRPMTPDGLPAIGPVSRFPRTFVAAGHNMHGLSLGPVTGDIIAQLVGGEPTTLNGAELNLGPFALKRMHRFW